MEPADTLLMGDEVISTTPIREDDEFIKSSVDYLVPILRESEVTLDSVLECDMPATTPLPLLIIGKHMVKQLFGLLLKNPRLTKGMSDEPLGDDTKPRSFDVTFSNPLFDFNDDFTLCKDNPLFDKEIKDISSLDLLS
ncbi:hypothetical protein Tco_0570812 [Tanacetum coccineum]